MGIHILSDTGTQVEHICMVRCRCDTRRYCNLPAYLLSRSSSLWPVYLSPHQAPVTVYTWQKI